VRFTKYLQGVETMDDETDKACSTHGRNVNRTQNLIWKPEGKTPLEYLDVDGRITLKWILKK